MEPDETTIAYMKQLVQNQGWQIIVEVLKDAVKNDQEALCGPNDVVNQDEKPESKRLRYQRLIHAKLCEYLITLPYQVIDAGKSHSTISANVEDIYD